MKMFFKTKKTEKPKTNGKHSNKKVGDYGEKLALRYLKRHGYKIVTTNYKIRGGEVDIIARDGMFLVFVEVKYRSNTLYGFPSEAVEYHKQNKIRMVASQYILAHPEENDLIRFDVVQIIDKKIELFKSAF